MVIWLASYPRSGNTFFRVLLHSLYGFETHAIYDVAKPGKQPSEDARKLMTLIGQTELNCDVKLLSADRHPHFVKTHGLPENDDFPAIVIVRDGRDAMVSYAYFVLKTERKIEQPDRGLVESTLQDLILEDRFGGWSRNEEAWINRVGRDNIIRYEDLIENPAEISIDALKRLDLSAAATVSTPPSFQKLHESVPWFFRKGHVGGWREEMPVHLQEMFFERHGHMLIELGYSAGRRVSL